MIIECTCFLYDSKMSDDLGIETEDIPAKIVFDTSEIESIRERIADKETDICQMTCIIYFRSGASFVIEVPYNTMRTTWDSRTPLNLSKKD